MSDPIWVLSSVINAMHDMQLAEHGGLAGTRDAAILESSIARPMNMHAYGETDLATLAAVYAFGIARNHPYVDGNKRTAFLAAYIFLLRNGLKLNASELEATKETLALASGQSTEEHFADWLRANTHPA